jgi:hypothetical protein
MRDGPLVLIAISTFLFSLSAFAMTGEPSAFVVEPYVAYERGYLTQVGIPEITTSGPAYGARIGYRLWGFGLGVDGVMGSQTTSQLSQSGDFRPFDLGAFVNVTVLTNFKLYGSYFIRTWATIMSSQNPESFSGSGYRVGVAWKAMTFLDVGLETTGRTYSNYDGNSISNALWSSTVSLSLAFPIL